MAAEPGAPCFKPARIEYVIKERCTNDSSRMSHTRAEICVNKLAGEPSRANGASSSALFLCRPPRGSGFAELSALFPAGAPARRCLKFYNSSRYYIEQAISWRKLGLAEEI